MITACRTGDLVTVKKCLDQGTDPNLTGTVSVHLAPNYNVHKHAKFD